MRNVTLAVDEREQLHKLLYQQSDWTEETFSTMDEADGRSGGRKWRRSDLYDV